MLGGRAWRLLPAGGALLGTGAALGYHAANQRDAIGPDTPITTTIDDDPGRLAGLESLPIFRALGTVQPGMHLLCPHDILPGYLRKRHLLATTLRGQDKLPVSPRVYVDEANAQLVGFYALGDGLAGNERTVHGGLLAALLDEMMAFTAVPQLPGRMLAYTSWLNVRYLHPVRTDSYAVIHTTTVGFAGDYDRKVIIRAVILNAERLAPDDMKQRQQQQHQHELRETFDEFQARMTKRFDRGVLLCVAEAEFVVPKSFAMWLALSDRIRSTWTSAPERRFQIPDHYKASKQ